jgi:hypothetical protein
MEAGLGGQGLTETEYNGFLEKSRGNNRKALHLNKGQRLVLTNPYT